ncbi:hypothetical protein JXQ70_03910 [bacterium]|nr:hypothetical protein [bacterium]
MTFVTIAVYAQDSQNPLDLPITLTKEEEESLQRETLEDILPGIDESQRFLYEPEGRRDPFQSLLFGMNLENVIRPAGIEGMNIAEIILVGILNWGEKGRIALFLGSDDKTYQRKVGDSVFDGKIIAIDKGTVLFEQKVYDPFGNEKPPKRIEIKLHPKKEEGL